MAYQVNFERSAEKELLRLPKPMHQRILKARSAMMKPTIDAGGPDQTGAEADSIHPQSAPMIASAVAA